MQFCTVLLNIPMKNTNFYPSMWQTFPNSLEMAAHWDAQGKCTQDLTLENEYATKNNVAAMNINITGLAAIDLDGKAHSIKEFETQKSLSLKSMNAGYYIKTINEVNLDQGKYTALRFYLKNGDNNFTFTNRDQTPMYGFKYLDFTIKNGLVIAYNPVQLVLRFDFKPFTILSPFRRIKQLFKNPLKFNLVKSFAN